MHLPISGLRRLTGRQNNFGTSKTSMHETFGKIVLRHLGLGALDTHAVAGAFLVASAFPALQGSMSHVSLPKPQTLNPLFLGAPGP